MGPTGRVNAQDPMVAEADGEIHKQVGETAVQDRAVHAYVNLHVTDWVANQHEDPIIKTAIKWISNWKVQDLKPLLRGTTNTEEGKPILQEQKKLTLYQGALYHCHTLAGELEEVLCFAVPVAH